MGDPRPLDPEERPDSRELMLDALRDAVLNSLDTDPLPDAKFPWGGVPTNISERVAHVTIALKAGVPIKVIGERFGHENPAFTMKQYAHVIPGMQAEAAALVAALVVGEK